MKIVSIPIALALLLLLVGFFTNVQHWPYNFEINLVALSCLGILYTVRYAAKRPKTLKDTAKVLVVLSWVAVSTLGLFNVAYIPYLVYVSLFLGLGWLTLEIIDLIKPKVSNDRVNPVLWVGIILMILFVLMKVQYWPFSNLVYVVGLLISAIGFMFDFALNRK